MQESRTYGWGLVGPGRFAREFAAELAEVDRVRRVAVASRNRERAASFAAEFSFEKHYGDYASLIDDDDVDIVYIVVPHVFHREIAELALAAGKAVFCEKPLTPEASQTEALLSLASEKGVFLSEAMKTAFLPAVLKARDWIQEGRIGNPVLARADFCFSGSTDPDDRLMNPDLGGGCVHDIGIYPLFLTRFLLGEIETIHAAGRLAATGVEDTVSTAARHESGAASAMTCSFQTDEAMDAVIYGSEGRVELPRFHAALSARLHPRAGAVEEFHDSSGGMVRAEIEAVTDALDRGLFECAGYTHADTIRLAVLMDEVIAQVRGNCG